MNSQPLTAGESQPPPARRTDGSQSVSVMGLVRTLLRELSTLMRQELALATAELSQSIAALKVGLICAAVGAIVMFAGLLALLASATLGLTQVLVPWLACLVIGVLVIGLGMLMLLIARSHLRGSGLKPKRIGQSLREDKDVLAGRGAS